MTPPPPTATAIPWWSNVIPLNMNSNWGWDYENAFNVFISDAPAKTGVDVPFWVIKAVIAKESSFNIYADSGIYNGNAKGLGQITGNGIGAILNRLEGNVYLNADIAAAYTYLGTTQPGNAGPALLLTGDYAKLPGDADYIAWYNRIQKQAQSDSYGNCLNDECFIAFQVRSVLLGNIDAQNATDANALTVEVAKNIDYTALALKATILEVKREMPPGMWDSLSAEDQWALTFAQYNIGVGNSASPVLAVIENVVAQGKTPTWDVVAPILAATPNENTVNDTTDTYSGTVEYANNILSLAEQGEH